MMLKFLRKKKTYRAIMIVTAIMIIPGFLIWGLGRGSMEARKSYAAVVNRQPITLQEYYKAVGDMEKKYREIFKDNYEEISKNLQLEKNILEQLIQEKVLHQQARKRRIGVGDGEVIEAVKSDAAFKDEKGVFSQERYNEIIARIPPEELRKIEGDVRQRLLAQKLRQQVVSETTIAVTDAEVNDYVAGTPNPETIDRENTRKMILMQKQERYFRQWYEKMRNEAKVVIYVELPAAAPTPPMPQPEAGTEAEKQIRKPSGKTGPAPAGVEKKSVKQEQPTGKPALSTQTKSESPVRAK